MTIANTPEALFAAAHDAAANLIVMGAYGRGRYTQYLFGGATSYALRNVRTPLFLRH